MSAVLISSFISPRFTLFCCICKQSVVLKFSRGLLFAIVVDVVVVINPSCTFYHIVSLACVGRTSRKQKSKLTFFPTLAWVAAKKQGEQDHKNFAFKKQPSSFRTLGKKLENLPSLFILNRKSIYLRCVRLSPHPGSLPGLLHMRVGK